MTDFQPKRRVRFRYSGELLAVNAVSCACDVRDAACGARARACQALSGVTSAPSADSRDQGAGQVMRRTAAGQSTAGGSGAR